VAERTSTTDMKGRHEVWSLQRACTYYPDKVSICLYRMRRSLPVASLSLSSYGRGRSRESLATRDHPTLPCRSQSPFLLPTIRLLYTRLCLLSPSSSAAVKGCSRSLLEFQGSDNEKANNRSIRLSREKKAHHDQQPI
jgi:hypothetical protein